jgi:hypothetical protein
MRTLNELTVRALATVCCYTALTACSDLKEQPTTFLAPSQFYKSDADAIAAVNGAYQPLMDWNLYRNPSWFAVMCDEPELECQNWMAGGFDGNQTGQWYISRMWTGDYQLIAAANNIIANVPQSAGISAAEKKLALGQAYFLRGWAYYDLAQRYGSAPIRLKPFSSSTGSGSLARAPLADTYSQAVKDLKLATDSLPATIYSDALGGGRPTSIAAWGVLAKVYLTMAGHQLDTTALSSAKASYADSARQAALQVINSNLYNLTPTYMDIFDVVKQNSSTEIMVAVEASNTGAAGSEVADYFTPIDASLGGGGGQGFVSLRRDFVTTFESGDLRIQPNTATFVHFNYSTQKGVTGPPGILLDSIPLLAPIKDSVTNYGAWEQQCGDYGLNMHMIITQHGSATDTTIYAVTNQIFPMKYVDKTALSKEGNSNNIILLRYAEVELIYAEAENEVNGPDGAAVQAINSVRQRAGLGPLGALSQGDFRTAVWTERQHELYGEFQSRWDLIREGRWLTAENASSTLAPYSADGPCRPRTAWQTYWPLPQSELSGNPLAKQNYGY